MSILDSLQNKMGPLKAWQWGIIGGGALAIIVILRGKGKSGGQGNVFAILPTTGGSIKQQPAGFASFGGLDQLSHFLCSLPNAVNNFAVSMPDGSVLSFGNGIGTFGNVQTSVGGQQQVVGRQWNPCTPALNDGPVIPLPSPSGNQGTAFQVGTSDIAGNLAATNSRVNSVWQQLSQQFAPGLFTVGNNESLPNGVIIPVGRYTYTPQGPPPGGSGANQSIWNTLIPPAPNK